jgi:hypothetical protein
MTAYFPVSPKQSTPHTPTQSAAAMHHTQYGTQWENTVISKTPYNCVNSAATPLQLRGKEQSDIHSCEQHSEYAQCSLD